MKVPEIGQTAPDFRLKDLSGAEVALSAVLPLAPLVLIFFRGASSEQCVAQLREYKKRNVGLYESGATILAICSDDADTAKALVDREKLPFRVLLDADEKVARAWGLHGIVATFVIDKAGCVRFRATDERTPAAKVLDFMRGQNAGQAAS
jgi:peroxiredoxin